MIPKYRLPLALAAAACLLVPLALTSAAPPDGARADETVLEEHMLEIEELLGKLRRSLRDPEQAAAAADTVAGIQDLVLKSKLLEPKMAPNVAEADRPQFLKDFRKEFCGMLGKLVELEVALLDGDVDAAKRLFGEVRDYEDSGHEKFTEDE